MRLILLGPPGAGKGTQAQSAGGHCTASSSCRPGTCCARRPSAGTPAGLKAQEVMARGELVPDEVVVAIVADRIEQPDCQERLHPRRLPADGRRRPRRSTDLLRGAGPAASTASSSSRCDELGGPAAAGREAGSKRDGGARRGGARRRQCRRRSGKRLDGLSRPDGGRWPTTMRGEGSCSSAWTAWARSTA